MPLWLKRSLFLVGVTAWVEGYYLAPYGFEYVAFAVADNRSVGDRLDADVLGRVRLA